jgi:hypothetical protein
MTRFAGRTAPNNSTDGRSCSRITLSRWRVRQPRSTPRPRHWDRVLCSAGKRGWDVALHPQVLIGLTNAVTADIRA